MNVHKNEINADFELSKFLSHSKNYSNTWKFQKTKNSTIQSILNKASKKKTGERGLPDLIYVNENNKILILLENKASIRDHQSNDGKQPVRYAVDGTKHYLGFFTSSYLKNENDNTQRYLQGWKIIGVAVSGNINDLYNYRLDTFIVRDDQIINIKEKSLLDEEDYLAWFESIDLEKIANDISKSSKKINNLLRNIDSQRRPILLSALMICMYPKNKASDFRNSYQSFQPQTIITNVPSTIKQVLTDEGIDSKKIDILLNELTFINTDKDLAHTNVLRDVLKELEENVIPLLKTKTAYDIIGKFYEEFLRYAGVANVKKGIVLTPNHITNLFAELVELKTNDVIFDPCCGTGAFLIASMNKLIETVQQSNLPNKKEKIASIKTNQLLGIEKSTTMFTLAISNMLFRGDGKSQIFNEDFFSPEANQIIRKRKPTIGFINPPFGGKDNKTNPTKKEIQFLERLLDSCSRYVIMIAPLSTYFKDDEIRTRILEKHTLKCVINMPRELFQPNATSHTAIAVFETSSPHSKHNKVVFYDLKDDGFVLYKDKGRTDSKKKWNKIKLDVFQQIANPIHHEDRIHLVYKDIKKRDEWVIQAHNDTDYSALTHKDFENTIKEYAIYQKKKFLGLVDVPMDELELFDFFKSAHIVDAPIINIQYSLNTEEWAWTSLSELFLITGSKSITDTNISVYDAGDYPYITTSAKNNGVQGFYDYYTENGNVLTVDSATIGICFYQATNFSASDHVEKLIPKFEMNQYKALFLQTLINREQFRYGYGRKFSQTRLKKSNIKLPVNSKARPNWEFMENYIKSLPYSGNL